ncbi:MAG: STAS domain-containing protein [Campylobacterota bacterium]|nr:STAS domain-containing protein [Campylobacterota bacterium]
MKIFSEDGMCFVDMEYALTINEVSAFKKDLIPLLATDKEFLIHCIDLKEIDSAGLQILISLKKQLMIEKITFEVTAGKKLKEFISFFMLDEYFAGDMV